MATLQARLAQGDPAAFAELYDAYADRVSHYLLIRLDSQEDADDALQETFLRLARNRKKLAMVEHLDAYIFTIARNESARLAGRKARRLPRPTPLSGEELFHCPRGDAEAREAAETVAAALAGLSMDLREIVELKTYTGLTFQQIGRLMDLPPGTVATRYRSSLVKMQTWLTRRP